GGGVRDTGAVEVGDDQRRRDELDPRGQGGDRGGGEVEIPLPRGVGQALEDGDLLAGDVVVAVVVAEAAHDDVQDVVAGHVGQLDPGRVPAERREGPGQGQVAVR